MSLPITSLRDAFAGLPRTAVVADPAGVALRLAPPPSAWPNARTLPADSFARGVRPELRFDLIVAHAHGRDHGDLSAFVRSAGASSRALLLFAPAANRSALLAALPATQLLGWAPVAPGDAPSLDAVLLRGQLRFPLLRVDDYPTGVRPLPADLAPIHRVLEAFETRSLPYCLGIVPGILTEPMFEFLRGLDFMTAAQHGYDHAYPRMAAKLRRRRDPQNERGTVGSFNEFRFHSYAAIERKLRRGKALLESRLEREVTTYIPPCNVCDRATTRALAALGFRLCLSERPVRGSALPVLASDFYGRSRDRGPEPSAEVICLHTNWEWDVARAGDTEALPTFLDRVLATTAAKQHTIDQAAALLRQHCRA